MAYRPVFIPAFEGAELYEERLIEFRWSPGLAESQKKKNIISLHESANVSGIMNILEISSKSDDEIGRRLSAFSLNYKIADRGYPLESVYQGSKVFEKGGPYEEIFMLEPKKAKKFMRNLDGGKIVKYQLMGKDYPLNPPNAFYDWLYIRSLENHANWLNVNMQYEAFTDIEFNPEKQINCQARAFAGFMSLLKRKELEKCCSDFEYFKSLLQNSRIAETQ